MTIRTEEGFLAWKDSPLTQEFSSSSGTANRT
jgi:hypothetical protein